MITIHTVPLPCSLCSPVVFNFFLFTLCLDLTSSCSLFVSKQQSRVRFQFCIFNFAFARRMCDLRNRKIVLQQSQFFFSSNLSISALVTLDTGVYTYPCSQRNNFQVNPAAVRSIVVSPCVLDAVFAAP